MVERIPITEVSPVVECGRYPVKAVVGESLLISATVFREGHDLLGAGVVLKGPRGRSRPLTRMQLIGPEQPDRYAAWVTPDKAGSWTFRIESWSDPYASWRHAAEIKIEAEVDVELMLTEGVLVLQRAAAGTPPKSSTRRRLEAAAAAGSDADLPVSERLAALTSQDVVKALNDYPLRDLVTATDPFPLYVDRERALVGAWYEMFPRSEGATYDEELGTWRSGTFATAAERLDAIAEMGFDVVYLPPIHPIGEVNRKGPNNTLTPGPNDPGSPWAIGSVLGGHDAVHPDLGTIEDFDAFVVRAGELGLEVAIDLALQCAPDHPWVTSHPEWFTTRADGTIAYAENPPKKYQDIYPLNFDNDYNGLSREVLRIVKYWMSHGVRIFRVDNPHTKPVLFWEWLLGKIRASDPDVVFLSEAFTRPAMMRALAMVGFHQSYTYFTWRNAKWELEAYLAELSHEQSDVMRPNLFVNTPDILPEYLQYGGPSAFAIRAVVASMASPTWGVYAGYELYEHVAVRPGSEEYLDSEKYQIRPRDWARAAAERRTLAPYITRLNEIRHRHPALQRLRNLTVHSTDDDAILCFSKRGDGDHRDDVVIVVVNLDPHGTRETIVHLDMPALGYEWFDTFIVDDELSGQSWRWGERAFVRLDPGNPARALDPEAAFVSEDPLWFKRAVFYEVLVRSFKDSNGDGIGDFRGLREKLDYLEWLGVDCLWIPPFYTSPLRDGGYDVADYTNILPEVGTLDDFQALMDAAHERGIKVIVDFVMNHTSDQHEWFQQSRSDPKGPYGDFYVWSDTDDLYTDARVIFVDTEPSNWTWDPVRQQYFWHRFYSHQPDLNFDNPAVHDAMLDGLRFWLDMGLDGFRLDAVPYLYERPGTNGENLPETHEFLRKVRKTIDAEYPGRVLLAEANQWPADVVDYFGSFDTGGDECHMCFHFPVMPRLFMAVRRESRYPISQILEETPAIPGGCQWGIFLRNHDELTLEMVTDEDRDYMWSEYAKDPRMKANIGIRRRLAPLLENDINTMELFTALLLSLPGSPVLYYGDEIGMGDNIWLGDRDGVRTPMQWTPDRNGGFSTVTPGRLALPAIMDPVFGYQSVNVEAQIENTSSLLQWTRRMIHARRRHPAFGLGSFTDLGGSNPSVFSFSRDFGDDTVLCVNNLSRFPQPVELDLRRWEGAEPVELLGHVRFPQIGELPYLLTLSGHSFYWFLISRSGEEAP